MPCCHSMIRAMFVHASLAALLAAQVNAIPSLTTLQSDLTILVENDLQGANSPLASSGLILLSKLLQNDAAATCKALGEELWAPESNNSSIQTNLDFLVHQGKVNRSTTFWIAPNGSDERTIDAAGHVSSATYDLPLFALCTQSAPYSNSTYTDKSEQWRITVHANNENITGFRDHLAFRFHGVRYATQPRRFTYSVPYKGDGGSFNATEFGPECVQGSSGSEDCLFLNIWTSYLPQAGSSHKSENLKPVMFWIHGGAYSFGVGSDTHYDGANIASRGDVVLVSINYRLTTLGFLVLEDGTTNGNFGFADQISALDWVRANIREFGGDPERITIFGQSAGAGSVRAMMASPKAVGKFSGVICQSNLGGINSGSTYSKYYTIPQAMAARVKAILNASNCTDAPSQVDCLRALPAYTLTGIGTTISYVVVDGTYITTDQLELSGTRFPFNLMMGTMRDDGAGFNSYPNTTDRVAYLQSLGYNNVSSDYFPTPSSSNQTLDLYNMSSRVATDGMFRCIDQATAYAGVENGRFNAVYYYEFDRSYNFRSTGVPGGNLCEPPATPARPHGDPSLPYFQCHSGELNYVFGNLAHLGLPMRDEHDLAFEQLVLDSWAAFARTYNPNPDPAYLKARGYQSTLDELERAGPWIPSTKDNVTMRVMEWPPYQSGFREKSQCDMLSLPLDYFSRPTPGQELHYIS